MQRRMSRTAAMIAMLMVSFAVEPAGATNWKQPAEPVAAAPRYPYKDLPGVTAPQDQKTISEEYNCHTETRLLRGRRDIQYRFDGMPQIVYVCERNGLISRGAQVPLRGHYQPVR